MTDAQLTKLRDELAELWATATAPCEDDEGYRALLTGAYESGFDAAVKLMKEKIAELAISRDRSKLFHSTELDRGDKLRQVLADYREALEFYGDKKHFIKRPYIDNKLLGDDGFKAREVLAKHKDVMK